MFPPRILALQLLDRIAVQLFDITHYVLSVEHFFEKSNNNTANIYVASLTLANNNKYEFLCKVAALDADMRAECPAKIYEKEINFYKNLVTDYKLLQNKYKVYGNERLSTVKFYGCNEKFLQETLVFAMIGKQGFVTFDRVQCINLKYAEVAVTELAKLHALSFAFKVNRPAEYEERLNVFSFDLQTEETEARRLLWSKVVTAAVEVTREENKERLEKYLLKNLCNITKFFVPLRQAVLGHGDFRPCNMIHRYTEERGLEIIIINYQTMQEMSPVVDLMYLLMTGTNAEFRRKHGERLRLYYYEQLCNSMRRLHVDPKTIYSREDFDFEWKQKLPFALCVAAFFLPISTMKNIPKTFNELMNCHTSNKSILFAKRMNEIVDDFICWGLL